MRGSRRANSQSVAEMNYLKLNFCRRATSSLTCPMFYNAKTLALFPMATSSPPSSTSCFTAILQRPRCQPHETKYGRQSSFLDIRCRGIWPHIVVATGTFGECLVCLRIHSGNARDIEIPCGMLVRLRWEAPESVSCCVRTLQRFSLHIGYSLMPLKTG